MVASHRQKFLRKLVKSFPLLQEIIIRNIKLQLDAGAEVVMIFDTAAGELSNAMFNEIVFPYVDEISKRFPKKLVIILKIQQTLLSERF